MSNRFVNIVVATLTILAIEILLLILSTSQGGK
jgi:hypothetical protein